MNSGMQEQQYASQLKRFDLVETRQHPKEIVHGVPTTCHRRLHFSCGANMTLRTARLIVEMHDDDVDCLLSCSELIPMRSPYSVAPLKHKPTLTSRAPNASTASSTDGTDIEGGCDRNAISHTSSQLGGGW